jgi:hypothetical protein
MRLRQMNARQPCSAAATAEITAMHLTASFHEPCLMGLAFGSGDRYFEGMSEKIRRAMTLLLVLTFIVGLVPHGLRAAEPHVTMVMAAATDMPMSGKCDGCGDDQKAMMSGVCSAHCGTFAALPLVSTLFEPSSVETARDFAGPTPAGYAIPPDPYPPRQAILS